MTHDTNGWSKAEMFVLEAIERMEKKVDAVDEKVTNLRVDVEKKGAIWGAVSATIVSLVAWALRS